MDPATDIVDIAKPNSTPKVSNHDILYGKFVPPIQRLGIMEDQEFEQIVLEWAHEYLATNYEKVKRCGGAGDKGRDIIAYIDVSKDKWDNYQCKHYGNKLTPTNFYVELGKLCYYTFMKDYSTPQNYFIVSREGVGTTLGDLIAKPENLKAALITNWTRYVENKITSKGAGTIKLENDLKKHVESFDFSIIKVIEPLELIDQHRKTSYFLYHFGGGIKKYRKEAVVPVLNSSEMEMRYIKQLLIAYSEDVSDEINTIEELNKHGTYKIHFEMQRKNFYSVETLKEFERDNLPPDSKAFDSLKDEIYTAVYSKLMDVYENSFKRLISVLDHSSLLTLTSNPLLVTISILDKQGVCHHLVNENKLSWKV